MFQGVFLPCVKGYNISKLSNGKYAVAVNNGNMGACQMDKQQFDEFISKQKEQGNVSASKATKVAVGTGIVTALLIGADFIFCKGKHVKNLLEKFHIKRTKTKTPSGTGSAQQMQAEQDILEQQRIVNEQVQQQMNIEQQIQQQMLINQQIQQQQMQQAMMMSTPGMF